MTGGEVTGNIITAPVPALPSTVTLSVATITGDIVLSGDDTLTEGR